jgi:predicted DNA-binding protein with PD1-like motif
MIVSQFEATRTFAGRLDSGQDIIGAIKKICIENSVTCGFVFGMGVLRNGSILSLKGETVTTMSSIFCPILNGNVSLLNDSLDVRLYAVFSLEGQSPFTGRLLNGEVEIAEFLFLAFDDATFIRDAEDKTGFNPWVQLQPNEVVKAIKPLQVAAIQTITKPRPPPITSLEEEQNDLILSQIKVGDLVDHPKFGECKVIQPPGEDKILIRLPSGKNVALSLSAIKVLAPVQRRGHKVFPVEIKKRL